MNDQHGADNRRVLLASIDEELRDGGIRLKFGQALEALFEHKRGFQRNRTIFIAGLIGLLIFNGFLFQDKVSRPEVFQAAVFIRLILVSLPCLLVIGSVRLGLAPRYREMAVVSGILVVVAGAMAINLRTHSAYASYDLFTFSLIVITSNIALPMKFWTALTATLASFAGIAIAVLFHPFVTADVKMLAILVYGAAGVLTLFSNYRVDVAERLAFLTFLRERLRNDAMAETNQQLEHLTQTDPLTGLGNRRHFDLIFSLLNQAAIRDGKCFSLVMIDIDHFKPFNDTFGHPQGDRCLMIIAQVLQKQIAIKGAAAVRLGGEEFAVLIPDCTENEALVIAERARLAVMDLRIPHDLKDGRDIVTISIGVGTSSPDDRASSTDLMAMADEALYSAKKSGRNRAAIAKRHQAA
jgi:diguanylate cyclase (GGDEF)-like protein